MKEWKGPWKCEVCGWVSIRRVHPVFCAGYKKCIMAGWEPYERRAPDPEKQELAEAMRELYDARVDSDWLIIKGHDEDGHPLSREGVARKQARALLRRYEEEK